MYAVNQSNDIRSLTQAADQFGITLPGEIPTMLDHLGNLQADQRQGARTDPHAYTADLVSHLGHPAAMTKARKAAAADLAASDAHQRITASLLDRCTALAHQQVRTAREDIAALFAEALAPQLATLNADAACLPDAFKAEHAADLDPPARFEAWTRARDAQTILTAARQALAMIYGRTTSNDLFTIGALVALSYTEPLAEFSDYKHAHRFTRALAGTRHGGSTLGPMNLDGVFAPTALAHLGATFSWAGPSEVARRAQVITAATVQPQATRERLDTAWALATP